MAFRLCLAPSVLVVLHALTAAGQQAGGVSIIQPGTPGQASRILSPQAAGIPARAPAGADVSFMQGMIHHHAQAVEMTRLLRARSRNKQLQTFAERIRISQADEMQYMKQWLEDRGKPVSLEHVHGGMPMMPGMLTVRQMQALAKASGKTFDRLFLTGMIQHHTGALAMVRELFDTPGAGQDEVLYDFATDVDNTQRAEIEIMQGMLKRKK